MIVILLGAFPHSGMKFEDSWTVLWSNNHAEDRLKYWVNLINLEGSCVQFLTIALVIAVGTIPFKLNLHTIISKHDKTLPIHSLLLSCERFLSRSRQFC